MCAKYQTASDLFRAVAEWAFNNPEQNMSAFCDTLTHEDSNVFATCNAIFLDTYGARTYEEMLESMQAVSDMNHATLQDFRLLMYLFLAEIADDTQDDYFIRPNYDVYEAPQVLQ